MTSNHSDVLRIPMGIAYWIAAQKKSEGDLRIERLHRPN
jgi:hypothetical protein